MAKRIERMIGWFRVHRKIFENPIFKDNPQMCYAFIWLVGHAAYEDTTRRFDGRQIELKRGQCCYSVRYLAEAWGISKSSVPRYISRFEAEAMLTRSVGQRENIITICKYEEYQSSADDDGTPSGTRVGQEWDNHGTNKKKLRNKEDKKGRRGLVVNM